MYGVIPERHRGNSHTSQVTWHSWALQEIHHRSRVYLALGFWCRGLMRWRLHHVTLSPPRDYSEMWLQIRTWFDVDAFLHMAVTSTPFVPLGPCRMDIGIIFISPPPLYFREWPCTWNINLFYYMKVLNLFPCYPFMPLKTASTCQNIDVGWNDLTEMKCKCNSYWDYQYITCPHVDISCLYTVYCWFNVV